MKRKSLLRFIVVSTLVVLMSWGKTLLSQERFRRMPPKPEPFAKLELPKVDSATLSNGLEVSVISRTELPLINLRLIIFAGEGSSPDKLPGLATYLSYLFSRGALNLSSSEIEEQIEYIGGTFSNLVYPDYTVFSFTFLEEYLDEALELLSRLILQPTFARIERDNVKRALVYSLRNMRETDPDFIAKRHLFRLLFKDHPYRKSTFNEDIINDIRKRDLLAFYNKFYCPNNAHIVLTGNLNLSTASRKVSRYLNTWKKKELKRSFIPPPNPASKQKICLVDLPRAKDATIYLGNIVLPITSMEVFPFTVFNQVLGGIYNGRLFMNLRESKGYAYNVYSDVEYFKTCSVFYIMAKVRPEVTYASIKEIMKEIEGITSARIPIKIIEQAKSYLIGKFPLQLESDNFSSRVSEITAFNLGEEHWLKYHESIQLINSKRVFEIAQKYSLLPPVVVIVGDKNILLDLPIEFEELEVYNSKGELQYKIKKGE